MTFGIALSGLLCLLSLGGVVAAVVISIHTNKNLTSCPSCDSRMPKRAAVCPNCGSPTR